MQKGLGSFAKRFFDEECLNTRDPVRWGHDTGETRKARDGSTLQTEQNFWHTASSSSDSKNQMLRIAKLSMRVAKTIKADSSNAHTSNKYRSSGCRLFGKRAILRLYEREVKRAINRDTRENSPTIIGDGTCTCELKRVLSWWLTPE